MIIAIDGYEANVKNRVGIGRFAFEIIKHIYYLLEKSKDKHEVRIYLPNKPVLDFPKETAWWKYFIKGPTRLWTFIGLPLALRQDKPQANVIFSPTHYVPRFINIPRVMAIMDLSYLEFPHMFKPKDLHQLRNWTDYSVKKSQKIITISEFTKNAIIKAYKVPEDRVEVIYPGLTMLPKQSENQAKTFLKEKYNLEDDFILSVGTLQPRKNYERLIEAFSELSKQVKTKSLNLVIIGKKGWLYDKILESPLRFGVEDRVKFLDFVPDADLPNFYQMAICLAFPSLYEGFGLPALEAMAFGCTVVVSNVSSLPEIAGKAAIYVEPEDVSSITKGLAQALAEKGTVKEQNRHKIGLDQAKKFTWENAAKRTLDILKEVGGK